MDKSSFTIADCFSLIKNGANIKQDKGQRGYPITRIETTSNNIFNRDKVGYAGIEDITPYQDYVLEDGDLLMSHINSLPYLGRVVYYERKKNETIIHGMNLLRLKAIKTRLLPRYATFLFSSTRFKNKILAIAKKSVNQASFSINDLKKQCIELPTTEQQDHIVSKLIGIQKIIQLRNSQLVKLDELVKCRFIELFGDPVTNSGDWKTRTIEQICENLDYKRKPIASEKRVSGIYPYYGASGIVDYVESYIFDEPLLLISEDGANLLARSTPIAFSVDGKIWVNNHAHVLKFHDIASQKYVEALFSLIDISHLITGSAQPKLNQEKLNSFSIPWPPIHLQVQYNHELYRIDKLRFVFQQSLDEAQKLFDSLMQEYFD